MTPMGADSKHASLGGEGNLEGEPPEDTAPLAKCPEGDGAEALELLPGALQGSPSGR